MFQPLSPPSFAAVPPSAEKQNGRKRERQSERETLRKILTLVCKLKLFPCTLWEDILYINKSSKCITYHNSLPHILPTSLSSSPLRHPIPDDLALRASRISDCLNYVAVERRGEHHRRGAEKREEWLARPQIFFSLTL